MYKKIKCHVFLLFIILNSFPTKFIYTAYITRDGKRRNFNKNNLRKLEISSKKFLHNYLFDAENNNLINNYLSAKYLFWNKEFKGQKIKLGILDSGINNEISKCKNIIKIKNFSDEADDKDNEGHGTYLSSIICGEKYGISKESEIYIYKIFTGSGLTKKEWLIEALKESIFIDNCKIINLSLGGINFNDKKIIDLINIASNKNIIIISSAGNEGPSYGTISFPGVLPNVLTIGSVSNEIFSIYKHSSRGPAMVDKNTLIAKPNAYAPGEDIVGMGMVTEKNEKNAGGVKIAKNGSSIATAIVTGFISLALSIKDEKSMNFVNKFNIASLINIVQRTNIILPELDNEYERFSGLFNPQGLLGFIINSENNENNNNKAFVYLYNYDYSFNNKFNEKNDKIKYPEDVLYSTKQEKEIILQLLNELDEKNYSEIELPFYIKDIEILYEKSNKIFEVNKNYNKRLFINEKCVKFELNSPSENENISKVMLLKLKIIPEFNEECDYLKGDIELKLIIVDQSQKQILNFFYSYHYIPKPIKLNRILFDRGHNLIYPYDQSIIKDNLLYENFDYDWTYESIDTNYKGLCDYLLKNLNSLTGLDNDYYIEETSKHLDLINLNLYAVLIIIDAEKSYSEEEIIAIQNSLENEDLGILIISEWNNDLVKNQIHKNRMRILSNYTNSTQYPILSKEKEKDSIFDGSNVPNLNTFLLKYDIALSQDTISGNVYLMNKIIEITSGTSISLFPKEGLIFGGYFDNDESIILDSEDISINQNINSDSNNEIFIEKKNSKIKKDKLYRAVLGVLDGVNKKENFGRLAIFTDSYCLDDYQYKKNYLSKNCFWLIQDLVQFLIHGMYIINDLNLSGKNKLKKNYYNLEPIFYEENTDKNKEKNERKKKYIELNDENKNQFTLDIPNLFQLELRKHIYFPNSRDILGIIKGVLVVFGIIFLILLIMLYKINENEKRNLQMRINAIKTLEEIIPLSMRINDRDYNKKITYFISSDEYFYFLDNHQ
jgi:membrane-bound transcription factor site-1 protease